MRSRGGQSDAHSPSVDRRVQSATDTGSPGGSKTAAAICREYQLKPNLLTHWKADFVAHASKIFTGNTTNQHAEARIAELERLVGRLTLELEVAKKAVLLSTGSSDSR